MAKKGFGPQRNYYRRIQKVQPTNLIGLWRFLEQNTSTHTADWSAQNNHGVFGAITMQANAKGPDGHKVPLFDGTSSYIDLYSAGLVADVTMAECSAVVWAKPASAASLADTTARYMLSLYTDANNFLNFTKNTTGNTYAIDYKAGGTAEQGLLTMTDADWHCLGVSVSDTGDYCKYYLDGVLQETDTGIGTWSGDLAEATTVVGSSNTTAADVWNGWIGIIALWNTPLSDSEHALIGTIKGA